MGEGGQGEAMTSEEHMAAAAEDLREAFRKLDAQLMREAEEIKAARARRDAYDPRVDGMLAPSPILMG